MTNAGLVAWILDTLERGATAHRTPGDRGGLTHWGVTLPALTAYYRRPATLDELARLSRGEAEAVWLELFIRRTRFDQIQDWQLRLALVQFAGNAGTVAAVKALQRMLGVTVDGVCGPETLGAANGRSAAALRDDLYACQLEHYARLAKLPNQLSFTPGWMRRVAQSLRCR